MYSSMRWFCEKMVLNC